MNAALRRRQEFCEHIKTRCLSSAVRSDQRMDRAGPNAQIHVIDGEEAAELFSQPYCFQDRISRPGPLLTCALTDCCARGDLHITDSGASFIPPYPAKPAPLLHLNGTISHATA